MKKAIRLATFITMLALAVSMFSACASNKANTNTDNSTKDFSDSVDGSDSQKESAKTTTTSATQEGEIRPDRLISLLNLIKSYPQGTAGSTVKSVEISIRLINYTQYSENSEKQSENVIKSFLSSLNDSDKKIYEANLYEIDYIARKLISGSTSTLENYIDQSQYVYAKGTYSLEKYEAIYKLLANT